MASDAGGTAQAAAAIGLGGGGFATLLVTSSVTQFASEKRFDLALTVDQVRDKVYPLVGTAPADQQLEVRGAAGQTVAVLVDGARALSSYGPFQPGMRLHVIDLNPGRVKEFSDTSQVEKYVMSDETYLSRKGVL